MNTSIERNCGCSRYESVEVSIPSWMMAASPNAASAE
jgi:hypothetical protein